MTQDKKVVVMGAGPAGLTAAWELTGRDVPCEILEADPDLVGGIARTASYKGFRFDIGGHRFFTKSDEVRRVWHEILEPEDWLQGVPRMSRIYYKGKFFAYPIKAFDALSKLGIPTATLCMLSYLKARAFPRKPERSLEDWVINRFGERLYRIFFKTYTEKVWGMPCSEIYADWAAQRIKGLSLVSAIRNAIVPQGGGKGVIKTLIDNFDYPKHGPGMMWERAAEIVQKRGSVLHMGSPVVRLRHGDGQLREVVAANGAGEFAVTGTDYISTLPIRNLVSMLEPAAPEHVRAAADALSYRDFLTVVLILDNPESFPDNWIYIHDPSVKVGRIQNFRNWSSVMVPNPAQTALGLEYFCNQGDALWEMADDELVALGADELLRIGLCKAGEVVDGTVVRMPKAYPVYDD